jgi:PAS domain S-box-containing protein
MARLVNRGGIRPSTVNAAGVSFYDLAEVEALIGRPSAALLTRSELTPEEVDGALTSNMESALVTLPELARSLMQADYAAVTVMDEAGRVEHMFYAGLTEEEAEAIGAPPDGHGVLGHLDEGDGILRLARISDHYRSVGFPAHHPPMQALLGAQVAAQGGRSANLYVANGPNKRAFTAADELKIQALARYVTLALNAAHLYEEEVRLRDQSEAAERRLEAVIQGSSAGVLVVDTLLERVVYASAEARRLTGLELRTGAGPDVYEDTAVRFKEDGSYFRKDELPLRRAVAERQKVGPVEITFLHKDGRKVPALVSAAPIFDKYGQIDTAVAVFMDMTRLKELDAVKQDFFSMITHDLRSPLATITGLSDAALQAHQNGDDSELSSNLTSIDEAVSVLNGLVENLLDMARIEAGVAIFEFEVCHMADIAADVVARIRRTREAQGREIHLNVPSSLPSIYADPSQIDRVLANLLSNALKYSDGTVEVSASLENPSGRVRTSVVDRGPGIPPESRKEIFEKFTRLKTGPGRGRQGSGLGLAICRSIVLAHNGTIGVDSVEGEGSMFWFSLPVEGDAH